MPFQKCLPIIQNPRLKHCILIHDIKTNREKMTDYCTTKLFVHQMLLYTDLSPPPLHGSSFICLEIGPQNACFPFDNPSHSRKLTLEESKKSTLVKPNQRKQWCLEEITWEENQNRVISTRENAVPRCLFCQVLSSRWPRAKLNKGFQRMLQV